MSSRFIDVPAAALLARIEEIGNAVVKKGGQCFEVVTPFRERVFAIRLPPTMIGRDKGGGDFGVEVQIFTSIATGQSAARGCGEDAIRLLWGVRDTADGFRPFEKGRRVFRTAPAGSPDARLAAFLQRFTDAVRDVYRAALQAPRCQLCGAPCHERKGPHGPFLGCLRYPACKGTRPVPTIVPSGEAPPGSAPAGEKGPAGARAFGESIRRAMRDEQLERTAQRVRLAVSPETRKAASAFEEHFDAIAEKHHGAGALEQVYPSKRFL